MNLLDIPNDLWPSFGMVAEAFIAMTCKTGSVSRRSPAHIVRKVHLIVAIAIEGDIRLFMIWTRGGTAPFADNVYADASLTYMKYHGGGPDWSRIYHTVRTRESLEQRSDVMKEDARINPRAYLPSAIRVLGLTRELEDRALLEDDLELHLHLHEGAMGHPNKIIAAKAHRVATYFAHRIPVKGWCHANELRVWLGLEPLYASLPLR